LVFNERGLAKEMRKNFGRRIEQPNLSSGLVSGGGSNEEENAVKQPTQKLGVAPINERPEPAPFKANMEAIPKLNHFCQLSDLQVSDRFKKRGD
jgi:hypothetical protein